MLKKVVTVALVCGFCGWTSGQTTRPAAAPATRPAGVQAAIPLPAFAERFGTEFVKLNRERDLASGKDISLSVTKESHVVSAKDGVVVLDEITGLSSPKFKSSHKIVTQWRIEFKPDSKRKWVPVRAASAVTSSTMGNERPSKEEVLEQTWIIPAAEAAQP